MKMMKWKLGMIQILNFPYDGENAAESTAWTAVWRVSQLLLSWNFWERQQDTILFPLK